MSNFLNKIVAPKAVAEYNKFDLSCENITTNDFFKFKVVYSNELVPNQSIKINMQTFSRLQPLVKPYYGSARFVNRAFFVPYRTIMRGFTQFYEDTKINGIMPTVPYVTNSVLVNVVVNNADDTEITATNADFAVNTPGGSFVYYKHTRYSKIVLDILCNLGYMLNFDSSDNTRFSGLPLLALQKVYRDWYSNKQYITDEWMPSGQAYLPESDLEDLFANLFNVQYEKDYFTMAWDNPMSPNNGNLSTVSVIDSTLPSADQKSEVTTLNTGTPYVYTPGIGQSANNFTQYIDTMLHKVTDFVKRKQLSGVLSMDRYFAQHGIRLTDAEINRSIYLGKNEVPLQVSDIMNTTSYENTSDNVPQLGEWAGKGYAISNNSDFTYRASEFGQLFIVSILIPRTMYAQGRDRQIFHLDRLDFWQPEFDKTGGPQAIRKDELLGYFPNVHGATVPSGYTQDGVFGYGPRYSEYKTAVHKDKISGDFLVDLPNSTSDGNRFHLARFIPYVNPTHNLQFCTGNGNQFDRVFADTTPDFDHFITNYQFRISSTLPMCKLYDDYEWDSCDNKKQSMPLNGTQMD